MKNDIWKMKIVCCQIAVIVLTFLAGWFQFSSTQRHADYVREVTALRTMFERDFARENLAVDEGQRMTLVGKFIKVGEKMDSLSLEAAISFQRACQCMYTGVIILALTSVILSHKAGQGRILNS